MTPGMRPVHRLFADCEPNGSSQKEIVVSKYLIAFFAVFFLFPTALVKAEEARSVAPQIEALDTSTMEKLTQGGEAPRQNDVFAPLVGTWNFDLNLMTRKGADPQISSGTVTNEMIMGNRFLSSKITTILNLGGQNLAYEGWTLTGYDTAKKGYTSVLADTLRTGMTVGLGQYDEKSKTLEQKGRFAFPLTGRDHAYRSELEIISADEYKQTVFIADVAGKEFKALEIKFHRQ